MVGSGIRLAGIFTLKVRLDVESDPYPSLAQSPLVSKGPGVPALISIMKAILPRLSDRRGSTFQQQGLARQRLNRVKTYT